ncbi:MAG: helix-turn-helix domain-containing protein [Candidatus Poseidoniales archaeon]
MVKGLLGQFSADQRTLLHLYEHQIGRNAYDAPMEITQTGIAAAIFVQRKHISRTLKKLEEKGLIKFELRHIEGDRQRKRTYELTSTGLEACHELMEYIKKLNVQKDGKRIEFSSHFPSLQNWLKILSHIDDDGVWHKQPLVSPVSEPEGDPSANGKQVEELIRRLFARAWEDGKITRDEQSLLNEVVHFWGIHPKRVVLISEEARGELVAPEPEEIYLEMLIQALEDGEIQDEEFGLLQTMKNAFGIDEASHLRLLELAKNAHRENPHLSVYKEALKTALLDGIITDDEDAMLQTLRTQFGITVDEHLELFEELRS